MVTTSSCVRRRSREFAYLFAFVIMADGDVPIYLKFRAEACH